MKLVHISDIHIDAGPILGSDPIKHFDQCLRHVEQKHADADLVVITGDLTHYGDAESYARLANMLEASNLTGKLKPRLLIGNHDNRTEFARQFQPLRDENGFIQWSENTPLGRFIYLDTIREASHEGELCPLRLDWLSNELAHAARDGDHAFLFMHHNPVPIGVPNADIIGLREQEQFRAVLKKHDGVLRHIFFGHCHYTLSGSLCPGNVPVSFSAPRSTNHPGWPDLDGDKSKMGYSEALERNYNIALIGPDTVVVHSIDFQKENALTWLELDESGWIPE